MDRIRFRVFPAGSFPPGTGVMEIEQITYRQRRKRNRRRQAFLPAYRPHRRQREPRRACHRPRRQNRNQRAFPPAYRLRRKQYRKQRREPYRPSCSIQRD